MTILAVDPRTDELARLTDCITANRPDAEIRAFTDPMLAYRFGANNYADSIYTFINMKRLTPELMRQAEAHAAREEIEFEAV